MRFHKDAEVLTADGTRVGTVDHLVIDPDQTDVTHIVVREGVFLEEDRLVPVEEVDRTAEDDAVILKSGAAPREFEAFIEDRYRQATVERPMFGPPGLALYPLPDAPGDFVGFSTARSAPITSTGDRPSGAEVIEPGSPVLTSDGRRLGSVQEVVTSDDGTIDGFIAESGVLWWKKHWLIPAAWVRDVSSEAVHLTATDEQVRRNAGKHPSWMGRSPGT
jgi:sporulation protein YlmC with PRC-barrel domain